MVLVLQTSALKFGTPREFFLSALHSSATSLGGQREKVSWRSKFRRQSLEHKTILLKFGAPKYLISQFSIAQSLKVLAFQTSTSSFGVTRGFLLFGLEFP